MPLDDLRQSGFGRAVPGDDRFRQRVVEFNEGFDLRYVHSYASGVGLCADLVGILKTAVKCWKNRYQLVLGCPQPLVSQRAPAFGWQDVLTPVFPIMTHSLFGYLNRNPLPGQRIFPPVQRLAGTLLRKWATGDLFMPENDRLGDVPDRIVFPELELDASYWEGMSTISCALFRPRPDVINRANLLKEQLGLSTPYVAIHIRRGDKIKEHQYTAIQSYVDAIGKWGVGIGKVFVASDDFASISLLRERLPQLELVTASSEADDGYSQARFDALTADGKQRQLNRFVAELCLMSEAKVFIGSSISNVFYFIRYLRGNVAVHDAESESGRR